MDDSKPQVHQRPFVWIVSGLALLWLSQPPFELGVLAWLAPMALIHASQLLTGTATKAEDSKPNWYQRPILMMWICGAVYWLISIQGVRLAHWSTHFGWLALGFYLGIYIPLFLLGTNWLQRGLKLPVPIAAAISWTGGELIRAYGLSGFSVVMIAQSQLNWLPFVQIADLQGAYLISFVIVFICGCGYLLTLRIMAHARGAPICGTMAGYYLPALGITSVLMAVLSYGHHRIDQLQTADEPLVTLALMQGATDTQFGLSIDESTRQLQQQLNSYLDRSAAAVANHAVDVVVWPESAFSYYADYIGDQEITAVPQNLPFIHDFDTDHFRHHVDLQRRSFSSLIQQALHTIRGGNNELPVSLMVGCETDEIRGDRIHRYNAALSISTDGHVEQRYFKNHLVMFGEYIPGGSWFPWLYNLIPNVQNMEAGTEHTVFEINGVRFAPSICFESTVPHLIRGSVLRMTEQSKIPDVLINFTNDGWFWGSEILDHHFRCNVLRAIEMRKPVLVSANTGIST
ncbi:MAG TPA: apolipoprotein N-acyltransferase, partial [Planctomycetaceae bacterium]|nr:apolipoprotein N-acyltransferase [Planctomycetaceae bacterium]